MYSITLTYEENLLGKTILFPEQGFTPLYVSHPLMAFVKSLIPTTYIDEENIWGTITFKTLTSTLQHLLLANGYVLEIEDFTETNDNLGERKYTYEEFSYDENFNYKYVGKI